MKIINYASGGLGNRIKPLATCAFIAKMTGRKLGTCWVPTMRCQTNFHDLFENEIELFDHTQLTQLSHASIYSERPYIDHDSSLNNNHGLKFLSQRFRVNPLSTTRNIIVDPSPNIIVYNNDFLDGYQYSEVIKEIHGLIPLEPLRKKVDEFAKENGINRSVIGVHARGTDFEPGGITVNTYIEKMRMIDNNLRFFVCSDSIDYEQAIKAEFKDRVIFRRKDSYVYKENSNGSWQNNVQTPKESVQDSLVDLYLLARTNFKIFHQDSTFAHLAQILSLNQ